MALIARITRATMLEVLSQDYVRTAKAKGVSQQPILFVHALEERGRADRDRDRPGRRRA